MKKLPGCTDALLSMLPLRLRLAALTASAVTLPAVLMLPPLRRPAVLMLAAVTLPLELISPEFSDVNVPTLVTFGCAAVLNVPVNNVPVTLPAVLISPPKLTPVS